jgi:hypothetical protein
MTFLYLTKSKEILTYLQENSAEFEVFDAEENFFNINDQKGINTEKLDQLMSKLSPKDIILFLDEFYSILDFMKYFNFCVVEIIIGGRMEHCI